MDAEIVSVPTRPAQRLVLAVHAPHPGQPWAAALLPAPAEFGLRPSQGACADSPLAVKLRLKKLSQHPLPLSRWL